MKTIIPAAIIVALAGAFVWQFTVANRLRDENTALRVQGEQSITLAAENERLSNVVAQTGASQPISKEQFQELLRLRGEVGVLRKQKGEVEKLQAENRQLRTATGQPLQSQGQTMSDFVPKESFTNVGYATAESAFQTLAWAYDRGDIKTILESYSPQSRAHVEEGWAGKSEAELAEKYRNAHISTTGFRIVNRKEVSADEVVFSVYIGGENESVHKMKLRRIGSEWKFAGE